MDTMGMCLPHTQLEITLNFARPDLGDGGLEPLET